MLNYIGIKSAMLWVANQKIDQKDMVVVGRSAMVCHDIIRTCHAVEVAIAPEMADAVQKLGGEIHLGENGVVTQTVHITPSISIIFYVVNELPESVWGIQKLIRVAKDGHEKWGLDAKASDTLEAFNAGRRSVEERTNQLRVMYRGVNDLTKVRVANGNRIVAVFKHRLGMRSGEKDDESMTLKAIGMIESDYRLLTDEIVTFTKAQFRKRSEELDVSGAREVKIIDTYSEALMVKTYIELRDSEKEAQKRIAKLVDGIPIWDEYLLHVKGCGPISAAGIISGLNIEGARYPSSFWKYLGLDVTTNKETGEIMGRRAYKALTDVKPKLMPNGKVQDTSDLGYNPTLKSKILFVMGESMIKSGGYYKTEVYDPYKARLLNREGTMDYKNEKGEEVKMGNKRHAWARRVMVKQFLADLFCEWKSMLGEEVAEPYEVAKLHQKAHSRRYFRECLALAKLNGGSPEDYIGPVTGTEPKVPGIYR